VYDAIFKILIFGDESPEKTTLIQKLFANVFVSDIRKTIGVDLYKKDVTVDGRRVRLAIFVFGGVHRFRFLLPIYVRGARGGLFVFDIADSSSIDHIDDWLSVIREGVGTEVLFPILMVGFLPNNANIRKVSTEEGVKITNSKNLDGYFECNPKTGVYVEKVFEALTRLMLADSR
jgi:small GTP-binding protein